MKNQLFLLFILFSSIIITSCSEEEYVEPRGLLAGFSFEEESIEFSSYVPPNSDFTVERTDEEAFDGAYSLKISNPSIDNSGSPYWTLRSYAVEVGQSFKIRYRVKTKNISGAGTWAGIFVGGADELVYIERSIGETISSTDGEWKTVEVALDRPIPDDATYIDIYFFLLANTTGTVYFDKLELLSE